MGLDVHIWFAFFKDKNVPNHAIHIAMKVVTEDTLRWYTLSQYQTILRILVDFLVYEQAAMAPEIGSVILRKVEARKFEAAIDYTQGRVYLK